MSKELEALSIIIETLSNDKGRVMCRKELDVLIQALNRLEAIDNANPSEALEWLNRFKGIELSSLPFKSEDGAVKEVDLNEVRFVGSQLNNDFRKFVYIIENVLIKAQEQEKVLNIIKEHLSFKDSGIEEYFDFKTNQKVKKYMFEIESKDTGATIHIHINNTQEEFDLLKRWLENE